MSSWPRIRGRFDNDLAAASQPPRWTSPESSARTVPSGSRTSRRPAASIPAPVPAPPDQRTGRSRSASRARRAARHVVRRLGEARLQVAEQLRQRRLQVRGGPAERRRPLAHVRRQRGDVDRDVDPHPEHRPARVGPRLHEDPRELAPVEQDVVRPLDARLRAGQVGDGEPGTEREQRVVAAEHERAEQRLPGGRRPRPALAPPPGGLQPGGHERAVRRARRRERPRAVVGRRGLPQVDARAAERAHAGASRSSSPGADAERARRVAGVDRHGGAARGVLVDERLAGDDVGERAHVGRRERRVAARRPRRGARSAARRRRGPPARRAARRCRSRPRRSPSRRSPPSTSRGRGSSSGTSSTGSSGGPASASGSPAASRAATGANRSRPWNVAATGSSRHGESEISTTSAMPPKRSAAGSSSPLSGPTRKRSSRAVRSATARRRAPTSGSTTARCTPGGAYGSVRASVSAPCSTLWRPIPCVRSMTSHARRGPRQHRVHDAGELVGRAVVGQERDRQHARHPKAGLTPFRFARRPGRRRRARPGCGDRPRGPARGPPRGGRRWSPGRSRRSAGRPAHRPRRGRNARSRPR